MFQQQQQMILPVDRQNVYHHYTQSIGSIGSNPGMSRHQYFNDSSDMMIPIAQHDGSFVNNVVH
jgi:hypothetical protein